jgi:hypothetical protein
MSLENIELIIEELDDSRLIGDVLGQHGGDRRSQAKADQGCNATLKRGTAEHWRRRLRRDRPDLAARRRR